MKNEQASPRHGWSFRAKAILWTVITLLAGVAGGYIAEYLTAPFYFGFFFTWVLVGLVAMFVLAVHVTNELKQRDGKP